MGDAIATLGPAGGRRPGTMAVGRWPRCAGSTR